MSILGRAVSDGTNGWVLLLYLAPFTALAAGLAAWLGVFRKRTVVGPPRLADDEPVGGVLIGLLAGFLLWLMIPAFLLAGAAPKLPEGATTVPSEAAARSTLQSVPPEKVVVVSTASATIAFAFMVGLAALLRRRGLAELGLSLRQLPEGITGGLLGACVLVPVVFVTAQLTELLWQALSYHHEKQHELLKMLGESERPAISVVLVASAVLVAPLFEETLFRGHLQTLLTYGLARLRWRVTDEARVFDTVVEGAPPPAPLAPPPPQLSPGVPVRWIAIVVSSLLFSAVHPPWTIPPIFVLSCCVGYAYERTGNLWTVIVMHAAFNLTSTVIFLRFANSAAAGAAAIGW
jgi:membrane protease YdiL (CAAX protease family)